MLDDVAMRQNIVNCLGEKIKSETQDFSRVVSNWGKGVAIGGPKNYWGTAKLLGGDNSGELRMAYLA